jgi:hypothetical protein
MVFDLFSKRQKSLRGEVPDVYTYDKLPTALRVQIAHIWRDVIGDERDYAGEHTGTRNAYKFLTETLCREYGVFQLPVKHDPGGYGERNYFAELCNFFLQVPDTEMALDVVELSFRVVDKLTREPGFLRRVNASELADDAIEELNTRFREHGVGYEFTRGEVIRVDSKLLHSEVTKPALSLLGATPEYGGAQAEFLAAHEHYRHGREKESLNEALKSLESLMKAICVKRGWTHDANATSKALIQVLFDKGLVPTFWNQHFSALRSTLEAGVPTLRNRLGGHGQGERVVQVPQHIVAYALHLTAAAIVFLAEAEKALP